MKTNKLSRKPILIAFDGSRASISAAKLAIHIAHLHESRICVVYIVDSRLITNNYTVLQQAFSVPKGFTSRAEKIIQLKEQGNRILDQFESYCRRSGTSVITEILFGGIPEVISKLAPEVEYLALGRLGPGHIDNQHYLGRNFRAILIGKGYSRSPASDIYYLDLKGTRISLLWKAKQRNGISPLVSEDRRLLW